MRKSDPPLGRASARKWGLIFSKRGAKASMKASAGSSSCCSYRSLLAANHSRLLFARRSARNEKSSGLNTACFVACGMGVTLETNRPAAHRQRALMCWRGDCAQPSFFGDEV